MNIKITTKEIKTGAINLNHRFEYRGFDEKNNQLFWNFHGIEMNLSIITYIGVIHGLMFLKKKMVNGTVICNDKKVIDWINNKSFKFQPVCESRSNRILFDANIWFKEQRSLNDVKFEKYE